MCFLNRYKTISFEYAFFSYNKIVQGMEITLFSVFHLYKYACMYINAYVHVCIFNIYIFIVHYQVGCIFFDNFNASYELMQLTFNS